MFIAKIKDLLPGIYDGLPVSVRKFISPIIEPANFIVKRFLAIVFQIRLPVYQFQGKNKWDDGTITVLLIGEGRGILPYILDLIYAEEPTRIKLGKIFIWKVKSQIKSYITSTDLFFIGIDEIFSRFLSEQGFIVIPEWVMFKLDLTKPLPKGNKNEKLNANIRKVKKYGYSFEITRDPVKFEYFYHHMYLPYAKEKYGKLSLINTFRKSRRIFERGMILQVYYEEECVSAALIDISNKNFYFRDIGVKDGKIEYIKQGALAACYYFTISFAKEKGYKWIDFGHCRPFFNDGAFTHKKTWGMEISKSKRLMLATKAVIGMKVLSHDGKLFDFLSQNPFIFIDEGILKGLIFIQSEYPLTYEEVKSLYNGYYIHGIDSLIIVSYRGFTQEAIEFASSQSPNRLHLTDTKPGWIL